MALKFLNKKGWHTGSLRNIENVWKAEQKQEAEQKKLEELRKQIHEERERADLRLLQQQAGLVPREERLDFLYESGLAVGKGSSGGGGGFKALEAAVPTAATSSSKPPLPNDSSAASKAAGPGALFEEKPHSTNDAWRKLHSDPLLLIRQREQEALARIKNNPVQMSMIRKTVEAEKKPKDEKREKKEHKKHHRHHHHKSSKHDKHKSKSLSDSEDDNSKREAVRREREHQKSSEHHHRDRDHRPDRNESERPTPRQESGGPRHHRRNVPKLTEEEREARKSKSLSDSEDDNSKREAVRREREHQKSSEHHHRDRDHRPDRNESERPTPRQESGGPRHHRRNVPKLTEEERETRLREMQQDAELHEEQRWKRLKKASEVDAQEASKAAASTKGPNFLEAAHKSVYGTEKGGSATIEESVRRRAFYSQGRPEAHENNAFRR
ncbi:hypothetical protein QJS10_CPB15g01269 [Acorus calamus]|uniref:CBF1-interacting co-repressor CIR N-terminal domain-containing protein n=1 Tax=Acorus calamus TaxID=4465 RepID=A0AAV9D8Y4_ACOCL|nr:hypothetical protein QJS10_CPB15g01269 [Acorus calamus]